MPMHSVVIRPDWPAPANVRAVTTTRAGGFSIGPYESFNLGDHVGDDPQAVERNRARLGEELNLPAEPFWLKQVHGVEVAYAPRAAPGVTADGSWTDQSATVLAVLTADCLPVFLCDRAGTRVAVLHAGWRGLAAGVIERGVAALGVRGAELLAWLGPAIGPQSYEIGDEVRAAFIKDAPEAAESFRAHGAGKWLADLYALARQRLAALGVAAVYGGGDCTLQDRTRFYSHRRDGVTGRMASLIWLAD